MNTGRSGTVGLVIESSLSRRILLREFLHANSRRHVKISLERQDMYKSANQNFNVEKPVNLAYNVMAVIEKENSQCNNIKSQSLVVAI